MKMKKCKTKFSDMVDYLDVKFKESMI